MMLFAFWKEYASLINGGFLVALVGMLLKNRLDNRKVTIEENKGLRTEFITEMHALRDDVKSLRGENDNLRKEVRELHFIIDGLRKQNLSTQIAILRTADECASPGIQAAMDALEGIPGVGAGK